MHTPHLGADSLGVSEPIKPRQWLWCCRELDGCNQCWNKVCASNPAGGACSDEQFRALSRRRPLLLLSWKGGLHQNPLDNKKMMREESSR